MVYLLIAFTAWNYSSKESIITTLLMSGTLAIYIVSLTLVARIETASAMDWRKWAAVGVPALVLGVAVWQRPEGVWAAVVFGAFFVLWFGRAARRLWQTQPQTGKTVRDWLAGICLVDGYFLVLLGRVELAALAGVLFVATVAAQRRMAGT